MESISYSALALVLVLLQPLALQPSTSSKPRFLEEIRVVSTRVEEGVVTFSLPGGELRRMGKGDVLEEEGGAKLEDVTSSTLVLTRKVKGGDGEDGEARIVVHIDSEGRTKVREYRTVGDVPQPRPKR
jgi:hypothetical protein